MREDKVKANVWPATSGLKLIPLIDREDTDGGTVKSVAINHNQVGSLIGRLMQMCDLIGDIEQRKALKDTIKQICRDWINVEYDNCGYERYTGERPGVKSVEARYYQIDN